MGDKPGLAPLTVTVLEPHLARDGRMPEVRYVGFEAGAVLTRVLGAGWRAPGQELEFRALDGFVSRIPVERFAQHRAWLVTARADGRAFEVDNHLQGERQVPLGPYYLVWDNRASKALQAEGGALWPYQVTTVRVGPSSMRALLPGDLAATYAGAADLARTHCLSCHRVRGYGGDKMPLDLDVVVKGYDAATWRRWLLEPAAVRPGTTMPALAEGMPAAERAAIAQRLYDYLRALPPGTPAR
ncbi:cytochrome c family protein [Roseateles aquatilis]|uniref:cytochrome c family protein n=1 Tax=Roseateles aquatilis TaxID=431061 RepID=UPI0013036E8A|nr:cytochrome c family protein [Roseateles aquatilis]